MSNAPLMPKATAVWLVDNTGLSFEQVADFCKMHPLEVGAIADGDAAQGIKGLDPVSNGQLTREEIAKAEADPNYRLKLIESNAGVPEPKRRKGRSTPVSRRHDRPNAILWLLRNHPELKDSQVMRLVGTTKSTIQSIRDRTHWNTSTLAPMDPVTLGLCAAQLISTSRSSAPPQGKAVATGGLWRSDPAFLLRKPRRKQSPRSSTPEKQREDMDVDAVFAKLKQIGGKSLNTERAR